MSRRRRILGGQPRAMRVMLDNARLATYSISPSTVVARLQAANARVEAGEYAAQNQQVRVDAGDFLAISEDVGEVVVAVDHGRPVYLRDVAAKSWMVLPIPPTMLFLGPVQEARNRTNAQAAPSIPPSPLPWPSARERTQPISRMLSWAASRRCAKTTLPADVNITTTRNYGETAKAKSDELLKHLLLATLSVTLLIALFLGWRESGVVLLAIPVTLALTLAVFYLYGYTLNRVTLFALIFSIGILVDDAIVVVENMVRHFRSAGEQRRPLTKSPLSPSRKWAIQPSSQPSASSRQFCPWRLYVG